MKLLLDCGNTRLKWAIAAEITNSADLAGRAASVASTPIVQRGFVDYTPAAMAAWAASMCTTSLSAPLTALLFSSVVSAEREQEIFEHLQPLRLSAQRFTVGARAGTLVNAYASPDSLGVDRWAAAIGAWGLLRHSCLIIAAGTATTIDLIEATSEGGAYRGGLILPGIEMMLQSLHQRAARLPQANGRYRAMPDIADNTHDAMISGVIDATIGAIERMGRRLPDGAPWLLTGGNASLLLAILGRRVQVVDDLVLEGLAAVSAQTHHPEPV